MKITSLMVVDDSEGDQLLTKITIESFDSSITILQAYDGREALDMLAETPAQPDLILLDINMPGMNGHEFLEEYSKTEQKSSVILMLSSSAQESDKQNSLKYPFVKKYIEKPVVLEVLEELSRE